MIYILKLLYFLPKRQISFLTGLLAELRVPSFILTYVINLYIKFYDVDLKEVKEELSSFKTFNDFFTRELKEGARSIEEGSLVSPVDGTFFQLQKIKQDEIIQVKGLTYSLNQLFEDKELALKYENGVFLNFYLSPKDYHNIHVPASGRISKVTHIPGDLWPVNMTSVENVEGLYFRNERVVVEIESDINSESYVLIMVGALNVGSIRLERFNLRSNLWSGLSSGIKEVDLSRFSKEELETSKGDKIGSFCLGSTVILVLKDRAKLIPEDLILANFNISSVKYGQNISRFLTR